MSTVLLDHVRPVGPARRDPLPVLKTVLYTLDISARFLAAAAVGRGTVARADKLLDGYWRRIFSSGNARLVVEGREHFTRPSIVVTNHTSLLDIPALMGAVPGSMRMVLKEELTKVPVWGPALVASGFVPVTRGTREKAIEQLGAAQRTFDQGVHVWVAPEGTRSKKGELGPFKKGAFHLARSLRAPLVPGWIDGASRIVPNGALDAAYHQTVTVRFGPAIEPIVDGRRRSAEEMMRDTRAAILALGGRPPEPVAESAGVEGNGARV
jgi:1-acyl-sn-glycerol-3-phosphate acyltransferase